MKKISIGQQFFITLREDDRYFADKSMLIGKILERDDRGIHLIVRPRRFGKSLNITMIDAFLNIAHKGNTWFDGLEISNHREFDKYKNAFPVVRIYLQNVFLHYGRDGFVDSMKNILRNAYGPLKYLLKSDRVDDGDKKACSFITEAVHISEADLRSSLARVCRMLHAHHGVPAVVLIDEYDTPLHESYGEEAQGYMLEFMRDLLRPAFEDGESLQMAVITGIAQIADKYGFDGLGNLRVSNVFGGEFGDMYGLTEREVMELCADQGRPEKFEEAKALYGSYSFGDAETYNPWGVTYYASEEFKPGTYWADTSGNAIIDDLLYRSDMGVLRDLEALGSGRGISVEVMPNATYADIDGGARPIYSLMAATGYLKAAPEGRSHRLRIPNAELHKTFADMLFARAWEHDISSKFHSLVYVMPSGDEEAIGKRIEALLGEVMGSRMLGSEHACQAFIAGALMHLLGMYDAVADFMADGRCDMIFGRKGGSGPSIAAGIRRLKPEGGEGPDAISDEALRQAAEAALAEIEAKMRAQGLRGRTAAYGAAFCNGKRARVASKWLDAPADG